MGSWNFAQLLLWLIVAQQVFAGLLWLLAMRVRIAPTVPALHWAVASAWTALTMAPVLAAMAFPAMPAHALSNLLSPGIFILVRIGVEILYRVPRHDAEHLLVIVLAVVCNAAGQWFQAPEFWPTAYSSVLNAFVLWRCQVCIRSAIRTEIGVASAAIVLLPLRILAVVFLVRALGCLLFPEQFGVPLFRVTPGNVAALAVFLTASVVTHLVLALAVTLRLIAKLRNLSRRDPLTGLLNRRGLGEVWPAGGQAFSLLVLDIDHFKRVNDHHGHSVGDLALQHLADLLRRNLRAGDSAARFGGEEFVLLLRGQNLATARIAAERLRADVERQPLRVGPVTLSLTVSLGVAQAREDDDADSLIARADQALYVAKGNGRNRVEIEQGR